MGIKSILWQTDVEIDGKNYDVLIPMPASGCQYLMSIGINEFAEDDDDDWDNDFNSIMVSLIGRDRYIIEFHNRISNKIELIPEATLSEIQDYLALNDHGDFVIKTDAKEIRFTMGHEIFWLSGFSKDKIKSIEYILIPYENTKIKKIF